MSEAKFTTYRNNLINAVHRLEKCNVLLYDAAVNVFMSGEHPELNDLMEEGDVFEFSIEMLETAEDQNVKMFIPLIKTTWEALHSLKNLNAITEEELEDGSWEDF